MTLKSTRAKVLVATLATCTLLLAAGLIPWRISDSFRDSALRRISLALNSPSASARDMRFSLLPTPRLLLKDVSFDQPSGAISAKADNAQIHLQFFSLLLGRTKPSGLALQSPDIHVRLPAKGEGGLRDVGEVADSVSQEIAQRTMAAWLPRLDIDNGRIRIHRGPSGVATTYDGVRLRLRAPGARQPISVSFRGMQGGEETRISFVGATPLRVATATREPVTFAYWTPHASLEFAGEGSIAGSVALNGKLTASASGTAAGLLSGIPGPAAGSAPMRVAMTSSMAFSTRAVNLSDLKLTVNEDRFEGVGSIRHEGQRWHLSGTLATDRADISMLLQPLRQLTRPDGAWNSTLIGVDGFFANNIDLRVSAEKLLIFGRSLDRAAIAFLSRSNKAEFTLGDAIWQKGSAKARLTASPGSFGLDVKIAASLERADMGAALLDLTGARRLTGTGGINLAIDTSGSTVAQFVANTKGRVSASLRGGDIVGIDLHRMATRRDSRRELALTEALGGRTPMESATFAMRISNGAAQTVDGHMRSGRLVGTIQGSIDFGQAVHSLKGSIVQLPADAQASEPAPVLDFTILGPLFEPVVSPNIASIFRRS